MAKMKTVKHSDAGDSDVGSYVATGLEPGEKIEPGEPVYLDQVDAYLDAVVAKPGLEATPAPTFRFIIPASPFALPPLGPGYCRRHIEAQLDVHQAATLSRLMAGLDHIGARLQNGRRVGTAADTVRWLLEWVAQSGRASGE